MAPSTSMWATAGAPWAPGNRLPFPRASSIRSKSLISPVRARNVHAPALDFEDYFVTESALMAAQKIRSYSSPRAALHYAVLLDQYRHCMTMANPLLRGLVSVLALLARRLGFGTLPAGS
jgi:hypothetical protein